MNYLFSEGLTLLNMFVQVDADMKTRYLAVYSFDKHISILLRRRSLTPSPTHSIPNANTAFTRPLSSSAGKWRLYALIEGTSLEELRH